MAKGTSPGTFKIRYLLEVGGHFQRVRFVFVWCEEILPVLAEFVLVSAKKKARLEAEIANSSALVPKPNLAFRQWKSVTLRHPWYLKYLSR